MVHRLALLTEEDQRRNNPAPQVPSWQQQTAPLISIPAKPCWEGGRAKEHVALPGVRKGDEDVAITDLGGEKQHLREQFFINLASTGIDLIWGFRV